MTSFEQIYNRFLSTITDYSLPFVPEEDLENMLHEWMLGAIVRCGRYSRNFDDRDEENKTFNSTLAEKDIRALILYMVGEWLDRQVNSVELTAQMLGGKEEKFFSQASHLNSIKALRDDSRTEARKLLRDYSYVDNSYFE